jgi:hypothetical protein
MQQMDSAVVIADESVLCNQHDVDHNVDGGDDDITKAVLNGAQLDETGAMNATSTGSNQQRHSIPHNRYNFVIMSLLFSANHGCVVACLSLATARLGGALGAWQSGLLYVKVKRRRARLFWLHHLRYSYYAL